MPPAMSSRNGKPNIGPRFVVEDRAPFFAPLDRERAALGTDMRASRWYTTCAMVPLREKEGPFLSHGRAWAFLTSPTPSQSLPLRYPDRQSPPYTTGRTMPVITKGEEKKRHKNTLTKREKRRENENANNGRHAFFPIPHTSHAEYLCSVDRPFHRRGS